MIEVTSKACKLKIVTEEDIDAIYELRSKNNKFLNNTHFTKENNRTYIEDYIHYINIHQLDVPPPHYFSLSSYYFSIYVETGIIGTIRMYNIDYNKGVFTWGSWIVSSEGQGVRVIISAIMLYAFAFEYLCLCESLFDVRNNNEKVISIHKKMGAIYSYNDNTDTYFKYYKEQYKVIRDRYNRYIQNIHVINKI